MVWTWNLVCGRFVKFQNGRKILTLLTFGCPAYEAKQTLPSLRARLSAVQKLWGVRVCCDGYGSIRVIKMWARGISTSEGTLTVLILTVSSQKVLFFVSCQAEELRPERTSTALCRTVSSTAAHARSTAITIALVCPPLTTETARAYRACLRIPPAFLAARGTRPTLYGVTGIIK